MGAEAGISKSEVSRICGGLDEDVTAFNGRDLSVQAFPYVFLDATYSQSPCRWHQGREGGTGGLSSGRDRHRSLGGRAP